MREIHATLPLADTLQALRDTSEDLVVMIVGADLPAVDRAMLLAAVAPLAVELAPNRRLCALDLAAGAAPADIAAALRFLDTARSTTGQVLAIA